LRSEADVGALGYLIGQQVKNGVPYLQFADERADALLNSDNEGVQSDRFKTLGAAMAASGAVALYHVRNVTPEARSSAVLPRDIPRLVIDDLAPGYQALNGPAEEVDLVSLGCPHASVAEIETIAGYLDGRQLTASLWITTARATREAADREGLVSRIESAGGQVVADTCMVVAPVAELGYRVMATNSAKMAFYAPAHGGLSVRFGSMEQCLEAAVTGTWPEVRVGIAPALTTNDSNRNHEATT
jgi:predicted aconitase